MSVRVGIGYDVHRLAKGHDLWIGGVKIAHDKGATGHSDADVLLHAICDALLGAANLGDIGQHFPDTSSEFKNISSLVLLERVNALIKAKAYRLQNIDATVVLQSPKIAPFIPEMKQQIADALTCNIDQVSVKATTTEGLGLTGREEGIAAYAVCLIEKD